MKSRETKQQLWLIVKSENGQMKVLTMPADDEKETLPVFSHKEEAEMCLWLCTPGAGWRTKETITEEVASVLYGPCAGVKRVALDPLQGFDNEAMVALLSMSRGDFLRYLANERELPAQNLLQAEVLSRFDLSGT